MMLPAETWLSRINKKADSQVAIRYDATSRNVASRVDKSGLPGSYKAWCNKQKRG